MVKKRIAEAIEEYEKTRANPGNASGSGPAITGGTVNVQGCWHKTFMNGKPHPFNGTEGVVGLRRWIEKAQKGNITSSNPTTLHEAINMARELVEQVVQGAERSFVSTEFTPFIDIAPTALNTSYEVDLPNGKVVSTNTVLRGCTLVLINHAFKIDLLPTRIGSFDVIVGMDWLAYHRAVIDCYEKIVSIPLPNGEILKVQGEEPEKDLRSLSCIKADEKKLDDIRIVCDFPKVFPDDLSGLPPVQKIEFRIDLILDALPVVRSPYRLAPSEMLELSNQLKEL
ncbi:putative reverse transcriptase domain-containing protein [Tanacetum coccineum]